MSVNAKLAAAVLAIGVAALATVDGARAADVVISSINPSNFVLKSLLPMYESASANKVAITYEPGTATIAKLRSGADLDLAIQTPQVIDDLMREGKITGGRVDLFISGVGLAVKAGAPKPDISSADALKKTLLAAKSVSISNGQSGTYFKTVLERLGIAEQMKPRLVLIEGRPSGTAAANGEAEISIQQVTELMPVAGIDVIGPLPAELQTRIVYSAGIPLGAKQPAAAKALLDFFASPQAAPVIKAKGLQPA